VTDKEAAPGPTEGPAALVVSLGQPRVASQTVPASKSQPKADPSEKAKSKDRDWLTTAELASRIGWREHSLRDALRRRSLEGVQRTSFGYRVDAGAVDPIKNALGPPPAKPNAPRRRPAARLRS
jgi:hypothetical protein